MKASLLSAAALLTLLATPVLAQTNTAAPGTTGAVGTPNSGQLNGPGSPTGTGIGATDGSVLPNVGGGNGFQNNTSINGASSTGTSGSAPLSPK